MLLVLLLLIDPPANADDLPGVDDAARARSHYMLNCQGCHGHDGAGNHIGEVPRMRNFVGNFLRIPGGREYLVRVPGSANAALTDAELAELLNWLLPTLSAAQLPPDFVPYSAQEVARLRRQPADDVLSWRSRLIVQMQRAGIPLD